MHQLDFDHCSADAFVPSRRAAVLTCALTTIRHAKIFPPIRCVAQRADQIAETLALAWKWFVRLAKRGKDASEFVTTFATFAARAVRCGRRVAGAWQA
jgi:hypothetical protein